MEERTSIVIDMIRSFAVAGVELTMTAFNKAGKVPAPGKNTPPPLSPASSEGG